MNREDREAAIEGYRTKLYTLAGVLVDATRFNDECEDILEEIRRIRRRINELRAMGVEDV